MKQAEISIAKSATVRAGAKSAADTGLPIVVVLFILTLVTPLIFSLGPVRLSTYRVLLLIFFFPSLYILFSGKVGKLRAPDYCVMLICFWSSVSLIAHYGIAEMVEPIGIFLIETMGAYMIGRCYIRTPEAFYKTIKLCFILVVLVTPFAVYEAATGNNLLLKMFDMMGRSYADVYKDRRMGLDRVQGPFAHPIHFGVFFGALVGVTYYVLGYGRLWIGRAFRTLWVLLIGALALSSGPLAALTAQAFFIMWDGALGRVKSRWYILTGLTGMAYVALDFLSNRNPFEVFISYLAFNAHTAYNRILIFEWGTKNIFDNPIFGIGYEPWERLSWMTGSFDMFWLLFPMQHGVPVLILYFWLFFWLFLKTARAQITDPRVSAYRVGYVSTLFGLFMSGWTVHYWDATFVFFIFLLSSGMWIVNYPTAEQDETVEEEQVPEDGVRYTRFRRPKITPPDGLQPAATMLRGGAR
ncbi:MAG: O-antigen ligase family protein [Sedimentitalea sp.]